MGEVAMLVIHEFSIHFAAICIKYKMFKLCRTSRGEFIWHFGRNYTNFGMKKSILSFIVHFKRYWMFISLLPWECSITYNYHIGLEGLFIVSLSSKFLR